MLFYDNTCRFQALADSSKGLSSLSQQNIVVDVCGLLKDEGNVDTATLDRSANTDEALSYVAVFRFDGLHSLVLNHDLYSERRGIV